MKEYRADLHVHTVLSPCASVEMIPPLIVNTCLEKGIDLIAITDHNSWENVPAVMDAARGTDLVVLPGVEITTQEEIHVLCIFDQLDQLTTFINKISHHLPRINNNPEIFGEQYIVDSTGLFLRNKKTLLAQSYQLAINEISELVYGLKGLFIPSHIHRKDSGILPILGWLPESLRIDALEIDKFHSKEQTISDFPFLSKKPIIQNGDVHYLNDFLGKEIFKLPEPNTYYIGKYLQSNNYLLQT